MQGLDIYFVAISLFHCRYDEDSLQVMFAPEWGRRFYGTNW